MSKRILSKEEENGAYHDSESIKRHISLLEEDLDLMFSVISEDVLKMTKLQIKSIIRLRKELLEKKKSIDYIYKALGKLKKNLKGDGEYKKIFIDITDIENYIH